MEEIPPPFFIYGILMKLTLLELTQDVLNAIEGEDINSISDSVESLQVANEIRVVYYDLIGRKDWQFLRKLTTLNSVSDITKPTHLLIPENASKMEFLFYNKKKVGDSRNYYQEVKYMYPDEFLLYLNNRDNTKSNYQLVTDVNGAILIIKNDSQPTYFTSFDDKYIVMDSFNSDIETTLQGTNTQISLFKIPTWTVDDDFTPDLPDEMFPLFLAECITFSQARKEEELIRKTEQTAVRHQRHLSQTGGVAQTGVRYPNYGRKGRKSAGSSNRSNIFGPRS